MSCDQQNYDGEDEEENFAEQKREHIECKEQVSVLEQDKANDSSTEQPWEELLSHMNGTGGDPQTLLAEISSPSRSLLEPGFSSYQDFPGSSILEEVLLLGLCISNTSHMSPISSVSPYPLLSSFPFRSSLYSLAGLTLDCLADSLH